MQVVFRITLLGLVCAAIAGPAQAASPLARCLDEGGLVRLARVVGPDGIAAYARVVADEDGVPGAVVRVAGDDASLTDAFARAAEVAPGAASWRIAATERTRRICSPLRLPQPEIDAEARVVVAAGLNYAAHAEEAGGGDVFVFPKPVSPSAPYGQVSAPAGATLLDYEVELGFVLLDDVDLRAIPSEEELLARSAFFVANEVTDREPIIVHAALSGPGTGFVDGKGQPGFLPAGPWLVRGSDLFAAAEDCGAEGLGLHLEVDEGDGFQTRQDASTAAMLLRPRALLARIADEVEREGVRSPMPLRAPGGDRHYPLAVEGPGGALLLPAGSVVVTGTPEGVALGTPDPLGLLGRGLLRLRGPFEQFRREQLARAASGEPGGYLAPGDRVRARIDGLGTQEVRVGAPGSGPGPDPCGSHTEARAR